MIRKSMFNFGSAPLANSMNFEFGQPVPEDPFAGSRGRFDLSPATTLEDDARGLKKTENPAKKFKATEALMEYINQQPKREDYKLGKWGTVGAALAAGAVGFNNPALGVATGRELAERPYARAMEDYATKGSGLKMAADLESDMYGQDLEYQKNMRDWLDKQEDNKLNREKQEFETGKWSDQQKQWRDEFDLKKDEMKAKGWEHFIDKSGNEKLINTITKEERNLGPSVEATRLANQGKVASAAVSNATTNAGRAAEDIRHNQNTEFNTATDTANRVRNTNSLIDTRANNDIVNPLDEIRLQAAAAKEVATEFPGYAKFINENGTYNVDNMSGFMVDESGLKDFTSKVQQKINEMRTRRRGQSSNEPGKVTKLPGLTIPQQ